VVINEQTLGEWLISPVVHGLSMTQTLDLNNCISLQKFGYNIDIIFIKLIVTVL